MSFALRSLTITIKAAARAWFVDLSALSAASHVSCLTHIGHTEILSDFNGYCLKSYIISID